MDTLRNWSIWQRTWVRYGLALVATGGSAMLRWLMPDVLSRAPYLGFYPAVVVAAILGGIGPGIVATFVSMLLVNFIFIQFSFFDYGLQMRNVIWVLGGIGVSFLAGRMHTARRRAEEDGAALRESEQRWKITLQSIGDAVMATDATGNISFMNSLAESLTGWKLEKAKGKPVDGIFRVVNESSGQSIDNPATCVLRLNRGVELANHAVLIGREGKRTPIADSAAPIRDSAGNMIGVVLVFRDVTEQREREEARRRLATIVETSDDAIISKSLDGTIKSWNSAAEKMLGYTAEEIVGSPITTLLPEDRKDEEERNLQALRRGDRVEHFETVRVAKDGRRIDVSLSVSPIFDSEGSVIGAAKILRDITDRKRAEEDLRQSEQRYRQLFANMLNGVAHCRMLYDEQKRPYDYVYLYTNAAFDKLTNREDSSGKTYRELFPGGHELNPELLETYARVVATGKPEQFEIYFKALDYWYSVSGYRAGPDEFVHVFENITVRKKAELALRESEQQFRNLANAIPQLCWMANADGWIFWYNDRWYEYTGTTPQQMEGWGWQSVHDPLTLPGVLERWTDSIATGEPFDMVFPLKGADGVFRPFLTRVMPIKDADGKVVRWFGTNTDVTELRETQQALRQSEERWATTLQSIGDAVISTCAQGKIVFMNEVAQKLTGWPLADAQGKDLSTVFSIVQEVTRIKPEDPVSKVLRLGKIVGLANHTALIRRDGTEIPIEDSAAPIRNREGQIEGVVLVFHDVIEQRKIEQALRNHERLATTGRLAASIAHEIHNPLDTVGNLLYLASLDTKEEETRQNISMALQELQRVTQMTRQMLTFQRESANPVPVRIDDVLENVLALYERKLKTAAIHVSKEIEFQDSIRALPGELRQILANLLGNAIEALDGHDGKIRIHAYASQDWRSGRSGLRVTFADNGKGIPGPVREKIFEPFFTTKGEGGTGLGLWITSGLVSKYEGTMRVWSSTRAGRSGTCFSVFIPSEDGQGSVS